jgi:hypothetical protein
VKCSQTVHGAGLGSGGGGSGSGGGALPESSEYNSRFGDPVPGDVTLPVVAVLMIAFATALDDAAGLVCKYRAATPATCGAAMDVPLMVLVAVLLLYHADVMLEPGAKMSRQLPQFEKDERASDDGVEPTVMASATRDGDELHASALLLPAATANGTPAFTALRTALSSVLEIPPPSDMFATAGLT